MDVLNSLVSQIQSLENGKGLQYLINEAYKILGNPVVLFNMEYEMIYSAENVVTDDLFWNEIVGKGVFSDEAIRFFLEECFIDDVANSKTIALLKSEKLKYERLYGRVFNSFGDTVADLIMVACDKPFDTEDAIAFEAFCKKLSEEIAEDEFFTSYGILYHEKLIYKLLDKEINDKVIYSGHLSNLYENLKANLYVVVADFSDCGSDIKSLPEIRDFLKELHPEAKFAVYSNYVVIITSSDETTPDVKRDLHKLIGFFERHNVRLGISGSFENLFILMEYYYEAVFALKH